MIGEYASLVYTKAILKVLNHFHKKRKKNDFEIYSLLDFEFFEKCVNHIVHRV